MRRLLGRERLNSRTYTRRMRWNSRWGLTQRLARLRGRYRESVIQDVDIPLPRAAEFLAFFQREIGILPGLDLPAEGRVAGPPISAVPAGRRAALRELRLLGRDRIGAVVRTGALQPPDRKRSERLGGIKSLYSDSFFTPEEFEPAYDQPEYRRLKARYDPRGRAPDLYDKCVRRA